MESAAIQAFSKLGWTTPCWPDPLLKSFWDSMCKISLLFLSTSECVSPQEQSSHSPFYGTTMEKLFLVFLTSILFNTIKIKILIGDWCYVKSNHFVKASTTFWTSVMFSSDSTEVNDCVETCRHMLHRLTNPFSVCLSDGSPGSEYRLQDSHLHSGWI